MRRACRPYAVSWVAFLVICAGIFTFKVWQNNDTDAKYAADHTAADSARSAALSKISRVTAAFLQAKKSWADGRGPAPTTQVVQKLLSSTQPIELTTAKDKAIAVWIEPGPQFRWELQFSDGAWVGYKEGPNVVYPMRFSTLAAPTLLFTEVEDGIAKTIQYSDRVWLALGLATLLTLGFRWGAPFAHLLLASAILGLLAYLMPARHPTPGPYVEFPMRIALAVLVIGLSALAIGFHHRPRKRRAGAPPVCENCGYNLTANFSGVCPECGLVTGDAPVNG